MLFDKEVMKNPEVESYLEVTQDEDLLIVEELRRTGAWCLAMLHIALENPRNDEWLMEWKKKNEKSWKQYYPEKQDRKQFAPSQLPEE